MNTTKLQPIPKHLLIEKLEQGWSVRRKTWADLDYFVSKNKYPGTISINVTDLLRDDWVGCPPAPTLRMHQKGLNFENALWIVNRQETVYLKHSKWECTQYIGWKDNKLAFFDESLNVIETNIGIRSHWLDGPDWEVWVDVCDPRF